jgi:hypothetical protein
MSIRSFTRVLSATALILALALLVATPVQARPLNGPQGIVAKMGSNFLDGALNWLSGFLSSATPATRQQTEKVKPSSGTSLGDYELRPNTGVCIDPQGNPCIVYPTQ